MVGMDALLHGSKAGWMAGLREWWWMQLKSVGGQSLELPLGTILLQSCLKSSAITWTRSLNNASAGCWTTVRWIVVIWWGWEGSTEGSGQAGAVVKDHEFHEVQQAGIPGPTLGSRQCYRLGGAAWELLCRKRPGGITCTQLHMSQPGGQGGQWQPGQYPE